MPRRSDLVKKLHKHLDGLKPALTEAGITDDKINFDAEGKEVADIEIHIAKLEGFETSSEYKEFMAVFGLKKPEWWANMRHMGETDLREHKLLRVAAKPLRSAWRKVNGVKAKSAGQ